LRCTVQNQIVIAGTGLGKSYAAIGIFLQLVSMQPNQEHCFYYATDSSSAVDQIIIDFRQYCKEWNISTYSDGKYKPIQSTQSCNVTVYISTHSALLQKLDGADIFFNQVAKKIEVIIFDEMESPIDAPVLKRIIQPFSRCFGMTGTLTSRDTTGYQVDLVATAKDCVKAGRTVPTKSFILHKNDTFDPLVDLVSRINGKFMLFTSCSDEYNRVFEQLSPLPNCLILKASTNESDQANTDALNHFRTSRVKATIMILIKKFVRGISVSDMAGVIDLVAGCSVSNKAQKAGRAIRLNEGKTFASFYHLVDPSRINRQTVFMHSSAIDPFVCCESFTEVFVGSENSVSRIKPDGLREIKYDKFFEDLDDEGAGDIEMSE
jgi:hypothetical protein